MEEAAAEPERAPEPEPAPGPFADVALARPVRREFTYRVPAELAALVTPGVRVAVPFGRRREVGVVVRVSEESDLPAGRARALAALLDEEPVVGPELLELTRWMAAYYGCAWGEALAAVLPAALKRERGRKMVLSIEARAGVGVAELLELEERFPKQHRLLRTLIDIGAPVELREVTRRLNVSEAPARTLERRGWATITKVAASADPLLGPSTPRKRPEHLSEGQARAVERVGAALEARRYRTFLLQGVTGSGKTEVYLRVIEEALAMGRGAIVLVPEIALTPQTVSWFRGRFGEVALLHSRMTDAQRLDTWLRVRRGELRVVVGARSAIFAPVKDLGVIVVDEEHEPSFKQANTPHYHARDVAVMRASRAGAVCILGSATPALETWHNAREGRYERLVLPERVSGGKLPRVEIVDMGAESVEGHQGHKGQKGPKLFSRRLVLLLEDALEKKQQAILFLNRRGYAPVLWCAACGATVRCQECDITLTFHRRIGRAVCHSCCEEITPPRACPECTAPAVRYLGLGSERVETALAELLPGARVARMDSDTMHRREDYERTLDAFGRGELDVLVGTQMIAKGLDFPNVTVVGIISADSALYLPDFRAAERTFQLLSQVAGRAGRGELAGEIAVQTMSPSHPSIVLAAQHEYEGFASAECAMRRELGYPPFGRLIRAVFEDPEAERARAAAEECAAELERRLDGSGAQILGPAPAAISKVRGRFRHHLLVKAPLEGDGFARARHALVLFAEAHARPRITVDIDPVSML
jgi:primosomal protein N' (replication factor Y)